MICTAGVAWVGNDLDQPGAVAQINEGDAAVIALAVYPAGEGDGLADVCEAKFTTSMRFIHEFILTMEIR